MTLLDHWNAAYASRAEVDLTWFEDVPEVSLKYVRRYLPGGGAMIDVGGGASRLVDHVLQERLGSATVLDLSAEALAVARRRLGALAEDVTFGVADVRAWTPDRAYDLWHDRAVLHFLIETEDQRRYLATLSKSLRAGGVAVIATFDLTGPERCSSLPVQRYSPATLADRIESLMPSLLIPLSARHHTHVTPNGNTQNFQFSILPRTDTLT